MTGGLQGRGMSSKIYQFNSKFANMLASFGTDYHLARLLSVRSWLTVRSQAAYLDALLSPFAHIMVLYPSSLANNKYSVRHMYLTILHAYVAVLAGTDTSNQHALNWDEAVL